MPSTLRILAVSVILSFTCLAVADDGNPIRERQGLMKDTRKAAGPVGEMLRGERDFDSAEFMASMETFLSVGYRYGDLFPEGSEFGEETEAAAAIWSDREGFNAALSRWVEATKAAKAAKPQSLDEARPVAGPIFQSCKGCHDDYRIET